MPKVRKEISRAGFLDVSPLGFKTPIDLRRVFLFYIHTSTCIFGHNVSFPVLYGGLYMYMYGQNLPYKFKNLYGPYMYWSPVRSETGFVILIKFWSRNDLRPCLRNTCNRNLNKLVDTRGASANGQYTDTGIHTGAQVHECTHGTKFRSICIS